MNRSSDVPALPDTSLRLLPTVALATILALAGCGDATGPEGSGEARSFTAYFEAEIEVEREFPSPLTIEAGSADRTVTVTLAPSVWFTRPHGSIVDLSKFDFEDTGRVGEFEVEIEDGVTKIEIEG